MAMMTSSDPDAVGKPSYKAGLEAGILVASSQDQVSRPRCR